MGVQPFCKTFAALIFLSLNVSIVNAQHIDDSLLPINLRQAKAAFDSKDFNTYFKHYLEWNEAYKESGSIFLKAESIYKYGNQLIIMKLYDRALAISQQIFDKEFDHVNDNNFIFLSYVNISRAYNSLGNHKEAMENYRLTLNNFKDKKGYELNHASALNNLGLQHLEYEQQQDSALHYFTEAFRIMEKTGLQDVKLYGTIRGNIASIYFHRGNFQEAEALFYENYYNYFKVNNKVNRLQNRHLYSGLSLIKTYLELNEIHKAEELIAEIQDKLGSIVYDDKISVRLELDNIRRDMALKQKNYNLATLLSQGIEAKKDSISNKALKEFQSISQVLDDITALNYETKITNEQLKRKQEKQQSRIRFWLVTAALVFILIVLFFLYNRNKQLAVLNAKKKELAEQKAVYKTLENDLLNQNIENQKQDLTNFALSTRQNIKWLDQLEQLIHTYKKSPNSTKVENLKALEDAIKDKRRLNVFTENFLEKVDTLNADFYATLKSKHHNLTDYEIKLCALIRINLESKDIASILNISPASVNTSRYRLRKKLNLEAEDNLTEYLKVL